MQQATTSENPKEVSSKQEEAQLKNTPEISDSFLQQYRDTWNEPLYSEVELQ